MLTEKEIEQKRYEQECADLLEIYKLRDIKEREQIEKTTGMSYEEYLHYTDKQIKLNLTKQVEQLKKSLRDD